MGRLLIGNVVICKGRDTRNLHLGMAARKYASISLHFPWHRSMIFILDLQVCCEILADVVLEFT